VTTLSDILTLLITRPYSEHSFPLLARHLPQTPYLQILRNISEEIHRTGHQNDRTSIFYLPWLCTIDEGARPRSQAQPSNGLLSHYAVERWGVRELIYDLHSAPFTFPWASKLLPNTPSARKLYARVLGSTSS
jgi:hypothetical protein